MTRNDDSEEFSVYIDRMVMMMQLLRIYELVLSQPHEHDEFSHTSMRGTMMAVVYSFFYSLLEESDNGINFFKIWRKKLPEFNKEIDELENDIKLSLNDLRVYRNRFGFHGSTSRKHELRGSDLLVKHSGTEIMNLIIRTRNLSSKFVMELERRNIGQ